MNKQPQGFSLLIPLLVIAILAASGAGYYFLKSHTASTTSEDTASSTSAAGNSTTTENMSLSPDSRENSPHLLPKAPIKNTSGANVDVQTPASETSYAPHPEIISFTASSEDIKAGDTTLLTLVTSKGNSCSMGTSDGSYLAEEMNVAYEGNKTTLTYLVRPMETRMYTAYCGFDNNNLATKELKITVRK